MRRDLEALVDDPKAKLDSFRAMSVANYVRALGSVSKARLGPTGKLGQLGKMSMAELIEEACKEPALREALRGME